MKVIDLLNKIANNEEVPEEIIYEEYHLSWDNGDKDYYCEEYGNLFEYLFSEYRTNEALNFEVETPDKEIKPLTKKDLETLGYACGEIKKCIERGFNKSLNNEPLEEDDEDILLIPDDELWQFNIKEKMLDLDKLNYNFKVLREKINEIAKGINEIREKK